MSTNHDRAVEVLEGSWEIDLPVAQQLAIATAQVYATLAVAEVLRDVHERLSELSGIVETRNFHWTGS